MLAGCASLSSSLLAGIASALLAAGAAGAADGYVGSALCLSCHPAAGSAWKGSHHAQAMQPATPQNVLGDFGDVRVEHHGQVTRFQRRQGRYIVRTAGADGRQQDFEVAYTFGVYPLQQYLIALPGGRLQAFGVAWDARPREAGGQRWYHLYPDDPPRPGEDTHWTGRDQNWNFMCASCHSTGVRKNHDPASGNYRTASVETGVGCEACHGPGAGHRDWAQRGKSTADPARGFGAPLATLRRLGFAFAPGRPIAAPTGDPVAGRAAGEVCFGCHARRRELVAAPDPRAPFLDNYQPSLLEPGLYHADGRIDGEVFEYGSFVQSAMYRAGVTCSHCHDSHSLALRAEGNALCAQCHVPARYDTPAHHRHAAGSDGAACVACHMPGKTYMGVDFRRDHGLRVPRPETSGSGAPDACAGCHADRPKGWAAAALAAWRGPGGAAHGAPWSADEFVAAWRRGTRLGAGTVMGSNPMPTALAATAAFIRASALASRPAAEQEVFARAVRDPDPLVRLGAAQALAALPPDEGARIGAALLADPRRAVRVEAARSLAGEAAAGLDAASSRHFATALAELIAVERLAAERPESHLNLARLQLRLGRPHEAEASLREALRIGPSFVPALVNLADLYRLQRRDGEAEPLLRQAATLAPEQAEPAHALGLLLVRRGRVGESVGWFEKAYRAAPGQAAYARVFALALQESGRAQDGLRVLSAALALDPGEPMLLRARVQLAGRLGLQDVVRRDQAELEAIARRQR